MTDSNESEPSAKERLLKRKLRYDDPLNSPESETGSTSDNFIDLSVTEKTIKKSSTHNLKIYLAIALVIGALISSIKIKGYLEEQEKQREWDNKSWIERYDVKIAQNIQDMVNNFTLSKKELKKLSDKSAVMRWKISPAYDEEGNSIGNIVSFNIHPIADYGSAMSELTRLANGMSNTWIPEAADKDYYLYTYFKDNNYIRSSWNFNLHTTGNDWLFGKRTVTRGSPIQKSQVLSMIPPYHCENLANWLKNIEPFINTVESGLYKKIVNAIIWRENMQLDNITKVEFDNEKKRVSIEIEGKGSIEYEIYPSCKTL